MTHSGRRFTPATDYPGAAHQGGLSGPRSTGVGTPRLRRPRSLRAARPAGLLCYFCYWSTPHANPAVTVVSGHAACSDHAMDVVIKGGAFLDVVPYLRRRATKDADR